MRIFFLFILLLAIPDLQAQLKVDAKVSAPEKVDVGQLFTVTFSLENAKADSLKIPKMKHLKLLAGPVTKHKTNTYIYQGRLVQTISTYLSYKAKADKKGKQEIASASIWHNGKIYKSEPTQIEVEDPEERLAKEKKKYKEQLERIPFATFDELAPEDIFVKYEWENKNVVVDRPNVLLLKLYYKVDVLGCDEIDLPKTGLCACESKAMNADAKYSQAVVNGIAYYTAVVKKYIITPKHMGECMIESTDMMAYIRLQNKNAYLGGTKQVKRRLVVPGLLFNVLSEHEEKESTNKKEKKQLAL